MVRLNEQKCLFFSGVEKHQWKLRESGWTSSFPKLSFAGSYFQRYFHVQKPKTLPQNEVFFYMFSQLRNRLPQTSMHPKPAMCQWDQNKMIIKGWTCLHLSPCCNIGYFGVNEHHLMVFWLPKKVFLNIQDHSGELWPQIPGPCRERAGPRARVCHTFLHHKASV